MFKGTRHNFRLVLAVVLLLLVVLARGPAAPRFRYELARQPGPLSPPPLPTATLVVLSDPHIFPETLVTEGLDFEAYVLRDRKLLLESVPIMKSVMADIEGLAADFVLVPGDLTKDGELESHNVCASMLRDIERSGKRVFVVPGNHDILNPGAVRYTREGTEPVPGITPGDFARIYADFGYGEALQRDAVSLSYLAEPVPGLWLLGLDACLYRENEKAGESVTAGAFQPRTLAWIEERLVEAGQQGKSVIVMMHHGLLEHFPGQRKYFGEYVVENGEAVARMLAHYGVRLVFTGHFHAQDITLKRWRDDGTFLYDVQTGSLVTYPTPYRVVSLSPGEAVVRTRRAPYPGYSGGSFQDYSRSYLRQGMVELAAGEIMKYRIGKEEALLIAGQVARAFEAHYAGDEQLPPGQSAISAAGSGLMGRILLAVRGGMVKGMWVDYPPGDNNVTLSLEE